MSAYSTIPVVEGPYEETSDPHSMRHSVSQISFERRDDGGELWSCLDFRYTVCKPFTLIVTAPLKSWVLGSGGFDQFRV